MERRFETNDISGGEIREAKSPETPQSEGMTREEFETWLDNRLEQDVYCRESYDDHGTLYRVGSELKPDNHYEINGYQYKTDSVGRITSAEGKLHLKEREGRLPIRDTIEDIGKGDELPGDDRGHLIGDQFDGSNGLENLVPQDAYINRNDFKNFENDLAREVRNGCNVEMKVEPLYEGVSRRPSTIIVTYRVNGEENMRFFPNQSEGLR